MIVFQKFVSILLILFLILPKELFAVEASEDISLLEAMREAYSIERSSNETLFREKEHFESNKKSNVEVSEGTSDILGTSFIVKQRSSFSNRIQNRNVKTELRENTMIFNNALESIDPTTLSIEPLVGAEKMRVEQEVRSKRGKDTEVVTFDFGIQNTHLIFSTPVKLSIDAGMVGDGERVSLYVKHEGDMNFNTKGLMTNENGTCLPDGSSSHPATEAIVLNGKVDFYTCGASTFAFGYVPKTDYPNNTVWTIANQSDGRTYIGGDFTAVGTGVYTRFARYTREGFVDTTFSNPNINNTVYASVIQADGKIIIGGAFTTASGTARNYLARLNTDGTLDPTWNPNPNNQVRTILIQPDGKVLIGGTFTTVGGVARNRIARINADGTLDAAFNPNSNNIVYTLALEPDNQILVGGTFTNIAATARNRVARLNANGTIDATFNPNANNTVWDIKLFSDGTIALGGAFTTIGGTARNDIAKVSAAGVLDAAWNPNANGIVYSLLPLSDNSLVFGGAFTTITAVARNRIAKVSAAGVLDTTFNPNANGTVQVVKQDIDGNLLVGGAFTTMSTKTTPYFTWIGMRIDNTPPTILSNTVASGSLVPKGTFPITLTYTDTGSAVNPTSLIGRIYQWNATGGVWFTDNLAGSYLSITSSTTSTGIFQVNNLPYGRYRFDFFISDILGNTRSVSYTYYVDEVEWSLSTPILPLGDIPYGSDTFGTGEVVITVRTIGAGFDLTLIRDTDLTYSGGTIAVYDGIHGWGYDKNIGSGYSATITSHGTTQTLISTPKSINSNGFKNTFTYRVKFGANPIASALAGDYQGNVAFGINLNF